MNNGSPLALPSWDLQRCSGIVGTQRWQRMAGQRVFMTGGTGFVGRWLLGTLIHANKTFDLRCQITVLSRNPKAFLRQWPLMSRHVSWRVGNICNLETNSNPYDIIIHAATDVARRIPYEKLFFSIIDGARRIVELAQNGQTSRLLLLSSGAIYGNLPPDIGKVPESYSGAPNLFLPQSAYGEGKRVAEWLISQASMSGNFICRIARVFSVVGPHLLLNQHLAVGNFIRDALANTPITINGDGSPTRSYLYAADMAGWLWSILLEDAAPSPVYNVGSEQSISIIDLAQLVSRVLDSIHPIRFKNSHDGSESRLIRAMGANHYVPDCGAISRDLLLPHPLGLEDAIRRTADWYKARSD